MTIDTGVMLKEALSLYRKDKSCNKIKTGSENNKSNRPRAYWKKCSLCLKSFSETSTTKSMWQTDRQTDKQIEADTYLEARTAVTGTPPEWKFPAREFPAWNSPASSRNCYRRPTKRCPLTGRGAARRETPLVERLPVATSQPMSL